MSEGAGSLSDREKQTLRLLLGGHDAKSIARSLDLSVHTVNERLRDARRKLGVASSREAARRLAEMERDDPRSPDLQMATPDLLGDKRLGVAGAAMNGGQDGQSDRHRNSAHSLFWLSGGMLIMSLIIAAAALSSAFHGSTATPPAAMPTAPAAAASASPAVAPAGAWVVLLDRQRWDESWDAAGTLFRSQLPKARWATTIQPVRQPLGPVSSRTLQRATSASSLPGAPPGDYAIIEFRTAFAHKADAVETVVLAREGAVWKVNGYFIR